MTSIVYKKTDTSEELYLILRIEVSWDHNLTGAAWKERDLTLKPTTLSPCPGVAQASKHILFIYRISTQAEFFLLYDFSSPNKEYKVFLFSFCCCDGHRGQSNSGKGSFTLQLQVTLHLWGKSAHKPWLFKKGQKPWRNTACWLPRWLFFRLMFSCFSSTFQDHCLRMVPPTMDWTLLHELTIKTVPPRHAHPTYKDNYSVEILCRWLLDCIRLTVIAN